LVVNHAKFIEEVRVPGFDLLNLGWFPGIVENPQNKEGFIGELYEVPNHLWDEFIKQLDYYEGYYPDNRHPSLFVRKEVEVNGEPTTVYAYNGLTDVFGKTVASGDWLIEVKENGR
jgi:hypothetical protein